MESPTPVHVNGDNDAELGKRALGELGFVHGTLKGLHTILTDCAQQLESRCEDEQRDALCRAMLDLNTFLEVHGFDGKSRSPIMRVVTALVETQRRRDDKLFLPRRTAKGGAPPLSIARMTRDGTLAALAEHWLQFLSEGGEAQPIQLRRCARQMKGEWFGVVTETQLRKALAVARESATDHTTRAKYLHLRASMANAPPPASPRLRFDAIIGVINETKSETAFGAFAIPKTPHVIGSGRE